MKIREGFLYYFTDYNLRNVFLPLEEIADDETHNWIVKSKIGLNRYANYLCLLSRYGKVPADKYTCQAVHEALAGCSSGIVFSLYNIFAILTKTEKTFYDSHIQEYFYEKMNLNPDDINYLTFQWHEPVEKINSLAYSADEELVFYNPGDDLMFRITEIDSVQSAYNARLENSAGFISSEKFFALNLLDLLAAIDLLTELLQKETATKVSMESIEVPSGNSCIRIENSEELISIFRAIEKTIINN
jgi:hypothetical protein